MLIASYVLVVVSSVLVVATLVVGLRNAQRAADLHRKMMRRP